ncbi:MAG: hypothetical protein ACXQS8_06480 [Candidatus Helarchaeales archaeon]
MVNKKQKIFKLRLLMLLRQLLPYVPEIDRLLDGAIAIEVSDLSNWKRYLRRQKRKKKDITYDVI